METIIKPSSKRYSVDICGETFTTQKSLIEKVKSVFGELETHQEFMKAFVSTYEKVTLQNTHIMTNHLTGGPPVPLLPRVL